MFRHKGKTRTFKHNLRLATLLSFVAGVVNVTGFLAVGRLTTNVTGHFAFFVDEIFQFHLWDGFVYFAYILFFLAGSFTSNLLVELVAKKRDTLIYVIPTLLESGLLATLAWVGHTFATSYPNILACSLLFAMGLQNSLVTKISNATVRTTHLTGLFTDLGIELSQLFFYKERVQRHQLFLSIQLRLTIIASFFFGGIIGGIGYSHVSEHVLSIAAAVLLIGIGVDSTQLSKRLKHRHPTPKQPSETSSNHAHE